jgi:hypothetical protein
VSFPGVAASLRCLPNAFLLTHCVAGRHGHIVLDLGHGMAVLIVHVSRWRYGWLCRTSHSTPAIGPAWRLIIISAYSIPVGYMHMLCIISGLIPVQLLQRGVSSTAYQQWHAACVWGVCIVRPAGIIDKCKRNFDVFAGCPGSSWPAGNIAKSKRKFGVFSGWPAGPAAAGLQEI